MTRKESSVSASIVAKIHIGILAGFALVWAFWAAPFFWEQAPIENIAKHIIAEDSFKIESLVRIKAASSGLDKASPVRAAPLSANAVLNLRLLEQAVSRSDQSNIDSLITETLGLIRLSLVNSPSDPFLWAVLFWLENTRSGFNPANLDFLGMSYAVGPNEGWVAVKRNRFALAVFSSLAPDITKKAVDEFSRLVESNYLGAAADILDGPGWPIREALLAELKSVDESNRQSFARLIYRRGLDLVVPGVERPDWRPWH